MKLYQISIKNLTEKPQENVGWYRMAATDGTHWLSQTAFQITNVQLERSTIKRTADRLDENVRFSTILHTYVLIG